MCAIERRVSRYLRDERGCEAVVVDVDSEEVWHAGEHAHVRQQIVRRIEEPDVLEPVKDSNVGELPVAGCEAWCGVVWCGVVRERRSERRGPKRRRCG